MKLCIDRTWDGAPLPAAGSWFNLTKNWAAGEAAEVSVTLPYAPVLEPLNDDRADFAPYFAVTVGPFAMGALTLAAWLVAQPPGLYRR